MTHKEDPAGEARQNLKDWKPKEPRRPFRPKPDSFGPSMKFKLPEMPLGDGEDEQEPNGSPQ